MLVIDESLRSAAPWFDQLQSTFSVVTISSLAGASVAIDGRDVAAIVIVLMDTHTPARGVAVALRRHPGLERTAIFAISRDVAMVAAELCGLSQLVVLTPEEADYELPMRVGAVASRMSSRPAPRRAPTPNPNSLRPIDAGALAARSQALARFSEDCVTRGERGLVLCTLLSRRDALPGERRRAADELSTLLASIRSDALLLQLGELGSVLALAEQAVVRLPTLSSQVVMPRGVSGLLSALRDFAWGTEAVVRFDVELHRMRLSAASADGKRQP